MRKLKFLSIILVFLTTYQGLCQTVVKQKLIANSLWTKDYNDSISFVDSFRYLYSGNRGTFPKADTGNIESISLYDSCYLAAGIPNQSYGQSFFSYQYSNNNRQNSYKSYDESKAVVNERWNTYYANDTLSNLTETFNYFIYNMKVTRIRDYNVNGILTRDSLCQIFFDTTSAPVDTIYSIKNVSFDNMGRILTIDSIQKYPSSSTQTTQTNFYINTTNILPDSDLRISITTHWNGYIDTPAYSANHYAYNSLNLLIETINYAYLATMSGGSALQPNVKNTYEYNSNGQITSNTRQQYNGAEWNYINKEDYEYTNGVNTLHKTSGYSYGSNTWVETIRVVSTLNQNNIVENVKTYYNGRLADQWVYSINEYHNKTKAVWTYYDSGLPVQTLKSYYYYYYINYDSGETSINSPNSNSNSITIYPNPAKNILKYKLDKAALNTKLRISITNISGKSIYEGNNMGNSGEIDLSRIASGAYILNVMDVNGNNTISKKFVKE